jgi:ribosomal protein L11 methyltransferase
MRYPALDVTGADGDLLLALVDDFSPTAVDEQTPLTTIYFATADARNRARAAVAHAFPAATIAAREVDDEDWARRSQENLQPIAVGRITIAPPWGTRASGSGLQASGSGLQASGSGLQASAPSPESPVSARFTVVILPSMGFGTGHHATTRLCLEALQQIDLRGRTLLDVGTGSGVLAIAARMLGARDVLGLDYDEDAIASARENLTLNPSVDDVRFETVDLRGARLRASDVITANLTGTLLVQSAELLLGALRAGGTLVVSGLQTEERDEVVAAFAGARLVHEGEESGWTGLSFAR